MGLITSKKAIGLFAYLVIAFSLWVFSSTVRAETFCVPTDYALQAALTEAASNGEDDLIKIRQGTYIGNFTYASTEACSLTIEGGYDADFSTRVVNPENTTLDAQNSGRVLALNGPEAGVNFAVSGLSIQNGSYNKGGGLYVNAGSGTLNLLHSTIHNNSMGGFYLQAGTVNISNSIISSNHSVSLDGQVILANEVDVSDSLIIQNYSQNDAGGLRINGPTITLRRNTITENSSDGGYRTGGGLYLEGQTIELSNNNISHNFSDKAGGGVWAQASIINVINNIIEFNQANNEGGGIKFSSCSEVGLINNIIKNNESSTGGGVDFRITNQAHIANNIITDNTALEQGGGLCLGGSRNAGSRSSGTYS